MSDSRYFASMKVLALSNPKGFITAVGNWSGTDNNIDILYDIDRSLAYLNNIPSRIMMSAKTYSDFVFRISFKQLYYMGSIFGCTTSDRSWLDVSDRYEDDFVIIVARSRSPCIDVGPDPNAVLIKIR